MKNTVGSFKGIFPSIDKSVYIDASCRIVGDVKIENKLVLNKVVTFDNDFFFNQMFNIYEI